MPSLTRLTGLCVCLPGPHQEYVVLALERLQQQQEATAPEAVLALESLAESLLAFVGLRVLSLPDLRSMLLSVVEHEPTRERCVRGRQAGRQGSVRVGGWPC